MSSAPPHRQGPFDRSTLALFAALGATSVITQAALLREMLGLLLGSELLIGLAFALWFAGICLGSLAGGRLAARPGSPGRLRLAFCGLLLLAALLPFGQLALLRLGRLLLDVPPGLAVPPAGGLLLLGPALLPFAGLVGLAFPVGARVAALAQPAAAPSTGRLLGRLYAAEAAGALGGGLLFSFVLAGRLAAFPSLTLAAVVLLLATAGAAVPLQQRARGWALLAAALVAALALAASFPIEQRTQQARLSSLAPGAELVDAFDTPYGNVLLARTEEQTTLYEDGLPTTTFPDPFQDGPRIAALLVQHPRPRRVCLLGGGMAGLISQLLAAGMERVVVVQADRTLAEHLAVHLPPRDQGALADRRVSLVLADPRRYLAEAGELFDLLYVVQPDPATMATNRFYTREFLLQAASRLEQGGVLALDVSGGPNLLGEEAAYLNSSLWRTLGQVFAEVLPLPGETTTFLASPSRGVLSSDIDTLDARLEALPGRTDAFAAPQLSTLVPAHRIARLIGEMQARPAGINRDLRPLAPLYHLLLWARRDCGPSREEDAASPLLAWLLYLSRLDHRAPAAAAGLLLLPAALVLRLAARRGGARRARPLITLFFMGFSAMAIEITLLLAYQELVGALYQMVASMVAVFMAGLAAASALMARRLAGHGLTGEEQGRIFTLLGLGLLLLAVSLPLLLPLLGGGTSPWLVTPLFGLLFLASGALTGAAFPLAAASLPPTAATAATAAPTAPVAAGSGAASLSTSAAAASANAVDHAGACLGAALTGSLLLPLFGIAGVGLTIAATGAALIVLWLER